MKLTDQYSVLTLLRKAYGASSFTEHHINYKRVGTKYRGVFVTVMGDTWDEVVDKLNEKIALLEGGYNGSNSQQDSLERG